MRNLEGFKGRYVEFFLNSMSVQCLRLLKLSLHADIMDKTFNALLFISCLLNLMSASTFSFSTDELVIHISL